MARSSLAATPSPSCSRGSTRRSASRRSRSRSRCCGTCSTLSWRRRAVAWRTPIRWRRSRGYTSARCRRTRATPTRSCATRSSCLAHCSRRAALLCERPSSTAASLARHCSSSVETAPRGRVSSCRPSSIWSCCSWPYTSCRSCSPVPSPRRYPRSPLSCSPRRACRKRWSSCSTLPRPGRPSGSRRSSRSSDRARWRCSPTSPSSARKN
mmetsp:Transcript_23723/g.63594  ORF Transcript_23723/g.63594 Transcript_23723/m.63594 type:complete len:210 (+) Transcript_23723:764-1393(+)